MEDPRESALLLFDGDDGFWRGDGLGHSMDCGLKIEDRGLRIEDRIAQSRYPRSSILDPRSSSISDVEGEALPTDGEVNLFPFLVRSEEHTSELQSLRHLVCRLLLEKK